VTTLGGTLTNIGSLTTDAFGTTNIGANITTIGTQTYGDAVTLTASPITLSTTDSLISFAAGGIAGGGNDLTLSTGTAAIDLSTTPVDNVGEFMLNSTGLTTLGGNLTNIGSLATDVGGTTNIGANITTTGTQDYAEDVTLIGASNLSTTNSSVTFGGGVTGGGHALGISTGSGAINLLAVNGTGALTLNTTGTLTLGAAIGATTPIGSLTVNNTGQTTNIGYNITSSGNQAYNNAIALTNNIVLTGADFLPSGNIQGGNYDLALNFTAPTDITRTTIDGAIFSNIAGITTGGGGITNLSNIAGDINQFVSQTYNDQTEILFGDVTLDTSTAVVPGNITFGGQVSGLGKDLALNTGTADIIFQSGTANRLDTITVTDTRNFTISGGTVSGTTFNLTGTGTADFGSTLNTTGDATINAYNAYGRVEIGGTLHLNMVD
jgi:hypothetical protein